MYVIPGHKHSLTGFVITGLIILMIWPVRAIEQDAPQSFTLNLGDYRFMPDSIVVQAGKPVILKLINTNGITPHNFTLQNRTAGLDIDTDVPAGQTVAVEFIPAEPGSYIFYCNKKLPFMKSHRSRGMEGTLTVTSTVSE